METLLQSAEARSLTGSASSRLGQPIPSGGRCPSRAVWAPPRRPLRRGGLMRAPFLGHRVSPEPERGLACSRGSAIPPQENFSLPVGSTRVWPAGSSSLTRLLAASPGLPRVVWAHAFSAVPGTGNLGTCCYSRRRLAIAGSAGCGAQGASPMGHSVGTGAGRSQRERLPRGVLAVLAAPGSLRHHRGDPHRQAPQGRDNAEARDPPKQAGTAPSPTAR